MKILIADSLSDKAIASLEALGASIDYRSTLNADEIPDHITGADVLIVRSTKVTKAAIEHAENLSLIIRAGAGVNTIDLETASGRGIHVANCPGKNADAVAELAMGLIIAADRNIAHATLDLRNGVWNKKKYGKAHGLNGRTLGIIGFGYIGKSLAERASSFGMNVIAWSRSLTDATAAAAGIGYCPDLSELAARSDVVSVHLAAGSETRHIVAADFFASMKDGAVFVNTSRGETVDTQALKTAIEEKSLKVALDVYESEPGSAESSFSDTELAGMITGTHHIGASTDQASEAIADEVVRIVSSYMSSGKPRNLVNSQEKSPAQSSLVIRHYNRVGVLAGVLDLLRSAQINIEEMENSIFSGGRAAVCTMKLDEEPDGDLIDKIGEADHIIQVALK